MRRESRDAVYTEYRIRDVAEKLRDGEYQLTVNGETLLLRLEEGEWLVTGS